MSGSSIALRARNTGTFCKSNWVLLRECAILVLPMVIFSAILFGLVIAYQWHRRHAPVTGLELSAEFSSTVFFIDYSASRLILVASWSSSTAFTLIGSFMKLLSYPLAADMIRNSSGPYLDMLPTPDQLALLINLLDGKTGSLWRWVMGLWERKKTKTRYVWALESSAVLLIFALILSLFIIAADTWLHVSTKSVPMRYLANVNPAEAGAAYRFSRALVENCRDVDNGAPGVNLTLPCSVYRSTTGLKALRPETINSMLLNNTGSSDTVYRDQATGLSFIGAPSRTPMSLSGDQPALPPRFNASTFAMNTKCSLARYCIPRSDSQSNGSFPCGSSSSQDTPQAWFALSSQESPLDLFDSKLWEEHYTWTVHAPYPSFHIEPGSNRLIVNSEFPPVSGSFPFTLNCAPSLFMIRYTWANDTMTELLDSSEANRTLLNILHGPFLSNYSYNDDHLKSFATRLKMERGNFTMEYYTQQYAALVSQIGLSFLGGSIESRPAIDLQIQNETVITQVPKTALFVLLLFNIWYALIGFCLFLVACYITACGGRGADVREVQELLTVNGLTTAAVSKARSHWGDSLRIGVQKIEDEWKFKVWNQSKDGEEINQSAGGEKLCGSPNREASKSLSLIQVVSLGSTHSGEAAENIVVTAHSPGSRHAPAAAPSEASFSPASSPNDSQMQLISQSLIWTDVSSQDSDEIPNNPSSPSARS